MLMQDTTTGALHEVPDGAVGYGEVVYDGLGNPVGFLPGIIGGAAKALLPMAGKLIGGLFGRRRRRRPAPPPMAPPMPPPMAMPMAPMPPEGMDPSMMPEEASPEGMGYGDCGYGEPVYDGFGNAVGFLPTMIPGVSSAMRAAARAVPSVASAFVRPYAQAAAPIFRGIQQGVRSAFGPITRPFTPGWRRPTAYAPPRPGYPGAPGVYPGGAPLVPGHPMGYRRPWPLGWRRPPLPYTGLGPQRMYMRCAVWPGPRGLVPGHALNMTTPPAATPGAPSSVGRRRRRRR